MPMLNEQEIHHHHVLTMIETAQRAGRSEQEIVSIVERYCVEDLPSVRRRSERGLMSRLVGRKAA
jgi:hypothetical protein